MKQLLPQFTHTSGEEYEGGFLINGILYKENEHGRLIPDLNLPQNHVGWMYDGVTADINGVLYKIHTRAESSEEYAQLST